MKHTAYIPLSKPYDPWKRVIDVCGAVFGLIVFSPVFLVLAVMVKRDSQGPILYRQTRITRHRKTFQALKFRTMTVSNDSGANDGVTSPDKAVRITKSGAFMRKYRLDELPQLWNVLVGEMSLVGPRPQTPRYVDIYGDIYDKICVIRPGITGLASIKFHEKEEAMLAAAGVDADRIYIDKILPLKFHYNLFYVRHRSLAFDMRIIWWTISGMVKKA